VPMAFNTVSALTFETVITDTTGGNLFFFVP
jgi:hypothetical protein